MEQTHENNEPEFQSHISNIIIFKCYFLGLPKTEYGALLHKHLIKYNSKVLARKDSSILEAF